MVLVRTTSRHAPVKDAVSTIYRDATAELLVHVAIPSVQPIRTGHIVQAIQTSFGDKPPTFDHLIT